jgi:hypothetical protein
LNLVENPFRNPIILFFYLGNRRGGPYGIFFNYHKMFRSTGVRRFLQRENANGWEREVSYYP